MVKFLSQASRCKGGGKEKKGKHVRVELLKKKIQSMKRRSTESKQAV